MAMFSLVMDLLRSLPESILTTGLRPGLKPDPEES